MMNQNRAKASGNGHANSWTSEYPSSPGNDVLFLIFIRLFTPLKDA